MLSLTLKNAFGYKGLSTRLSYLLYGVLFPFFLAFLIVLMVLPFMMMSDGMKLDKNEMEQSLMGMLALIPFGLAVVWVGVVQVLKRLRDLGHSGLWILLILPLSPLPYLGTLVSISFYAYLQFFSGKSKDNPQRKEWLLVLGGMLLAGLVIGFEIQRSSNLKQIETIDSKQSESFAETGTTSRVATPAPVAIAMDYSALSQALGKQVQKLAKVTAENHPDLDGDGINDVFVADSSTDCGNGGCSYMLIISNKGSPKTIGEIEANKIEALPTSANGLRDLKTTWRSGCEALIISSLKFDGYRYKTTNSYEKPGPCAEKSAPQTQYSQGVSGTVLAPLASANPRQLNQEGIAHIRSGQFVEASRSLAEASTLAPRDVEILGNYGYSLLMAGDAVRAEEVLKRALIIKPNRGSTLNNLGLALAAQGHESEAKDFFVRYVAASSNKSAAFNQLHAWSSSPNSSVALRNAANSALMLTK